MNEQQTNQLILRAKSRARWQTIFLSLLLLFGIGPLLYLASLTFYTVTDRANDSIKLIEALYEVTDPMLRVDERRVEATLTPFFHLTIRAPLAMEGWDGFYEIGTDVTDIQFGKRMSTMTDWSIPRPVGNDTDEEETLSYEQQVGHFAPNDRLHAFVTFAQPVRYEHLQEAIGDDVRTTWLAVETKQTGDVTTIGFPTNDEHPVERFKERLAFIAEHEEEASERTWPYDVRANERLADLADEPLSIQGASVLVTKETLDAYYNDGTWENVTLLYPVAR